MNKTSVLQDWQLLNALLEALPMYGGGGILLVERKDGVTTVSVASAGELRWWEKANSSGFRRYPTNHAEWSRRDNERFLPLEQSLNVCFFCPNRTRKHKDFCTKIFVKIAQKPSICLVFLHL